MASAAALFLAINGSHPLVGSLLLSVCSLLLLSPLVVTVLEFSGLSQTIYPFIPNLSVIPRAAFLFAVICINTRVWTSMNRAPKRTDSSIRTSVSPYWIPGVGHLFEIIFIGQRYLKWQRDSSDGSLFTLNIGGGRHNFICDPVLITDFKHKSDKGTTFEPLISIALSNVFSIQRLSIKDFDKMYTTTTEIISKHLLNHRNLDNISKLITSNFRENLPNIVSFMPSLVDQMPWERASGIRVSDTEQDAQADLLSLVQSFVGINSLPAFTGAALLESYPELLADLSTINANFFLLALGVPRWYPVPGLVPVHLARKRLLSHISSFNSAIDLYSAGKDPGSTFRDLSDVNEAYIALQSDLQNFNPDARAGVSAYILWTFFANPALLTFWTLLRTFTLRASSPDIFIQLQEEIAPYTKVTQSPPTLGISEPPRISLDVDGLVKNCSRLKACFIETTRLDVHSITVTKLRKDIAVSKNDLKTANGSDSTGALSFQLRKDEYVDLTYCLHNSDPKVFELPEVFLPMRHLKEDGNAQWGGITPHGTSEVECGISQWTERLCLTFVSSFLAMWEFEPIGKDWKIPKKKQGIAVDVPRGDVKVKLKRKRALEPVAGSL